MILTIIGCGKKEEVISMPSPSLSDSINEEMVSNEECPEGYVYDYQVSMEPIPEEIAALGGDVCGTIHAYPTRIKIALAKKEIENDVELQKQNEKNIAGVKQYLVDTYGGEFEVEPLTTGIWSYMCTEIATKKSFVIYISSTYIMNISDEIVSVDTYFYEEKSQQYVQKLNSILSDNIQEDYVFRTRIECLEDNNIFKLKLAIFKENEIDYIDEQTMIISVYNEMKKLLETEGTNTYITITITYFSPKYQEVIENQYNSNSFNDLSYIHSECVEILMRNHEIIEQFDYQEAYIDDEENQLKKVILDRESYFENEYILSYWRGRE